VVCVRLRGENGSIALQVHDFLSRTPCRSPHSAASLKGHRPHRVLAPCVRLDDLGDDSETDRRRPYCDAARQRHDAGFSGHAVVSEVPYGVMTVAADRTRVRMHGASVPRHQNPYASPPARSIPRHFLPVPGQLRGAAARPL